MPSDGIEVLSGVGHLLAYDHDGTYLGKYRKNHIPQVKGFWEKFYFRPGNGGYPVFDTAVGKIGVYICYDRHFPEGARALGLNGAEIVLIPSATSRGPDAKTTSRSGSMPSAKLQVVPAGMRSFARA